MKSYTLSSAEFSRISREEMLMDFAEIAALRSTCTRKRVGAVAALEGRPIVIGYAGSAPGEDHCIEAGCIIDPHTGGCIRTQHAEANLIAFAARKGIVLYGSDLFCTVSPCLACAKLVRAAGIINFYYLEEYRDQRGRDWLNEHGVRTHAFT